MEISRPANPYVGPSAFRSDQGHLFFGRGREAKKLLSLISSTSVALFYAPSGAGKTSLLNARIVPALRKEGVEVLPIARVGGEVPRGQKPANSYVFNVLSYLSETEDDPDRLEGLLETRLKDYFNGRGERRTRVMILDQFEEIMTVHPSRPREREEFFQQVREALESVPLLTVVFSLREDYIAGLDRYAPLLPDRLRDRFRMERLGVAAAVEAVRGPAEAFGRPFADGAAEQLVFNLRQEKVAGHEGTVSGELVEPVQLQVVCFQLWENLRNRSGVEITTTDLLDFGDVDQALGTFFDTAVKRVARKSHVPEMRIVRWFGKALITRTRIRGQVHREPATTGKLPNRAVDLLVAEHLIRRETARGGVWYELVHDRFIEPILASKTRRERKRRKRWIPLLAAGLVLVVLAFSSYVSKTQEEARAAEAGGFAALAAEALQNGQPQEALQLAHKAAERTYSRDGAILPDAEDVLRRAIHDVRARRLWTRDAGAISAIASSPGGEIVATGRKDGSVSLWNVRTGAVLLTLHRHTNEVTRLALAPRGEALATLSLDDTAIVWDTSSTQERFSIDRLFENVSFSRDGRRLVTSTGDVVEIWDANSGDEVTTLVGHTGSVFDLSFSSDGEFLATVSEDGTTRLWDVASGTAVHTFRDDDCGQVPITVAFSRDGAILATAPSLSLQPSKECDKDRMSLWDVEAGQRFRTLDLPEHKQVTILLFTPDGGHLVAAAQGGAVRAWKLDGDGDGGALVIPQTQGHVAVSDHGSILAAETKDGRLAAWELLLEDHSIHADRDSVRSIAFASSGDVLATAGSEGVRLWDVATLATLPLARTGEAFYAVAFSEDGGVLAAGGKDGKVQLWDMRTREPLRLLESGEPVLRSLAFQPGERHLVTAGITATVRIWDVDSGEELRQFHAHEGPVVAVAFHPDGRYLATASYDKSAKIWDLERGLLVTQLTDYGEAVTSVAFSPDGENVATGSKDGVVKIYAVFSGKPLYAIPEQPSQINAVAYSPNGKRLITASGSGAVIVWDAGTGERLFALPGPEVEVKDISFGREGEYLAVARVDGTIRLEVMKPKWLLEMAAKKRSEP